MVNLTMTILDPRSQHKELLIMWGEHIQFLARSTDLIEESTLDIPSPVDVVLHPNLIQVFLRRYQVAHPLFEATVL